ncbi:hypothetical protein [Streptomyces hoynatensis]|uniref:Uncharacterized protein n=1 Tax=Streptomyces hoynatensis TaxID=1141874 RepID=A0A3A9YY29_9ACTN|nr:hypothetical protein [Streptomyces hoynatensis]RKN40790.1 hypothetical protein D7294_17020 [Streptomyces hoynatensis]
MRSPLDAVRDLIAETTTQRALDRRIREAVRTDPDAALIFQSAHGRPQRFARHVGDPRFDQRSAELQQYAEVKVAKGEFHLFRKLFR